MKRFFISLILAAGFSILANLVLANLGLAWTIVFVALVCLSYLKANQTAA